jgi:hypothetical protein
MMTSINYCFRRDKKLLKQSFDDPDKMIEYMSTADYYEAKCDYVLRRKFPKSAKILNRIKQIFSQMMIITILMLQGIILALQKPSLFFWGMLIFSLSLQSVVINSSSDNPQMYKKCVRQSRMLKNYSMIVLIA